VLDAAGVLAPTIANRAAEVEAARRIPEDLLDALDTAGCFRMLLPRTHGGTGADLPSALRLFQNLAMADASVAWTVMIGAAAWLDLAGLPRTTFDALHVGKPGVVVAGAFAPTGSITAVDGGIPHDGPLGLRQRLRARPLALRDGVEQTGDRPRLRTAVLGRDQVEIEDTWMVSGLCGTVSHHIRITGAVVPAGWTLLPLADEPCLDEPVVRVPIPALIALSIASVAVGTAQGALDDAVALAPSRVPFLAAEPLAADRLFRTELATEDAGLRAARALVQESATSLWATAVRGAPATVRQRAAARAAAVWATERAAAVVDAAYRSGGGTALYRSCPLQRRLRDVHAMTQHFVVRRDALATAGAVLMGQDIDVPVF
jgi:alkylation response protein AidB-like acyl-CoA dehydrogenase